MASPRPVPRVAVGLPVRNGEALLAQTLDDFLAQTFEDFEVVVCDNASTDGTVAVAERYAARDPRIRVVPSAVDVGALANFNRAFFEAAPAPYFVWSAYDDRHAPDFLERLVGALDADPSASLAYGQVRFIGDSGRPLPYDRARRGFVPEVGGVYHDDLALEGGVDGPPSVRFERVLLSTMNNTPIHGLFRRSVLERTSLHQFYGADTLLLAEAALAGPFRYVDAPVFEWRLHLGGTAYLTREEWAARETGDPTFRPTLPLRSVPGYVRAIRRAGLGPGETARALWAVARYLVQPGRLARIFVPGPNNYFGIGATRGVTA